jgi:hypothetical protein
LFYIHFVAIFPQAIKKVFLTSLRAKRRNRFNEINDFGIGASA